MRRLLKTKSPEGLRFRLHNPDPNYPELGPSIVVLDGDYQVASYLISTLREHEDGWCVTSGRFEKYRAVDAQTKAKLLSECDSIIAKATGKAVP